MGMHPSVLSACSTCSRRLASTQGEERKRSMQVNGLQLPAALVQILQDTNGETTGWMLKDPDWRKQVNAYGDEFDLGDFMILKYDTMVRETDDLPGRFD